MAKMVLELIQGGHDKTLMTSSNEPITSFPAELLHSVLSDYQPVYNAETIEVMPDHYKTKYPQNWPLYANQLLFFAQLRLVCKSWYHFITPLLYSTFTLPTHPYKDLERVSKAFNYYPELIDHLVLRGHVGDASEHRAAEILATCLSRCTDIHTIEIIDAHRIFRSASKSKCLAIFRALPSTVPLDRLIFRVIRPESLRVYPVSITLLGLGPLIQQLKTLEIHDRIRRENVHDYALFDLPSSFPNLQRLVVRNIAHYELGISKLVSRIFSKGPRLYITPDTACVPARQERTVPLRDLTLSLSPSNGGAQVICTLLSTNNLGQNLTTLRLDAEKIYWYQEVSVPCLPYNIIAACPRLKTFLYFIKCPDDVFSRLPATIEVFGILVDGESTSWGSVESISINDYEPLTNWLKTWNEGRLRKLILRFSAFNIGMYQTVEETCKAASVEMALG